MTCNESLGDNLPSLVVREAVPSDIRSIFELANLASVRDASFSSAPIKWEEHVSWFQAALADPLCGFYVAETGRLLAGQVRFSREGEQAVVSISVNPGFRGKGIGVSLYHQGLAYFRLQHPVSKIIAKIKNKNEKSIAFFKRLGFTYSSCERIKGEEAVVMVSHLEGLEAAL